MYILLHFMPPHWLWSSTTTASTWASVQATTTIHLKLFPSTLSETFIPFYEKTSYHLQLSHHFQHIFPPAVKWNDQLTMYMTPSIINVLRHSVTFNWVYNKSNTYPPQAKTIPWSACSDVLDQCSHILRKKQLICCHLLILGREQEWLDSDLHG